MYKLKAIDDTIVAIATAFGVGGIGIVRLSGSRAIVIVEEMFKNPSSKKLSQEKSYTAHYGWIVKNDEVIDEVVVILMKAPRSYTKEDVVEISCHGGSASLRSILTLATELGARLAEPGEFTKRAFLNGRIDLTQAEAVLDIVHSKTDTFLRVSANQLKGELSTELEIIREQLMNVYVEMEAIINFPEDEIDAQGRKKLSKDIEKAQKKVNNLLASSEHGRILKEGIKIVICGKPNVGKSSLLNVLLKTPRAIVSDIAGTTRDTIEETAQIQGIPFQLIDTAGILEPRDLIEEEAIKRSRMYIKGADLVLLVLDNSSALTKEDYDVIKGIDGQNTLVVVNKCDLKKKLDAKAKKEALKGTPAVEVSVLKKTGIDQLESTIVECVLHAKSIDTHSIFISNLRHIEALKNCQSTLAGTRKFLKDELSLEFISEEIKLAVNFLDNITGRNIDQDLIENIFSQFCIGK